MNLTGIKNLIAQGRLEQALDASVALFPSDTAILLRAQFNNLKRQNLMGVISSQDHQLHYNRILNSLLEFCGGNDNETNSSAIDPKAMTPEQTLLSIIEQNKRRRPQVATQAKEILDAFRNHRDSKIFSAAFDPSGRRLAAINVQYQEFLNNVNEVKKDSLEEIVGIIMDLLSAPVPSYKDLAEAYELASGRGMNDPYIITQLNAKPIDDEVKFTIAEKIEAFIGTIRVK